jgi:hypothetical protein
MINNLTYPIHLNVTLNGSLIGPSKIWWNDPSVVALIGVLGIVFGAIAAGLFQFLTERRRIRESEKNNRILAHSNLLGCKHATLQYYESYLVSIINAENSPLHSTHIATKAIDFSVVEKCLMEKEPLTETANQYASQKLALMLEKSIDLKEGLRYRQRADDLALQLANTDERFWRIIGQVKTLFPDINATNLIREIGEAESDLDNSRKIINSSFNKINRAERIELKLITSNEKRDSWFHEKEQKLKLQVDSSLSDVRAKIDNLDSKIDNLLDYLEDYLKRKSWWQFWRSD